MSFIVIDLFTVTTTSGFFNQLQSNLSGIPLLLFNTNTFKLANFYAESVPHDMELQMNFYKNKLIFLLTTGSLFSSSFQSGQQVIVTSEWAYDATPQPLRRFSGRTWLLFWNLLHLFFWHLFALFLKKANIVFLQMEFEKPWFSPRQELEWSWSWWLLPLLPSLKDYACLKVDYVWQELLAEAPVQHNQRNLHLQVALSKLWLNRPTQI